MKFNLSQKIWNDEKIYIGDVKEFIRILKEGPKEDTPITVKNLHKFIDELAGEYLI